MYNRIIQFNDFKIFRNEKEVVILDIENGKLVKVDERTLKVIQNNNLSKEELFQKSKKYFNEEEFNSLVNAMENAGFLKYVDSKNESSIETYTKENIVGITLMLVQGCNLACSYCFGDEGSYCDSGKMSKETAFKAIDYLFEHSDADKVLITFFGGEPLLAVDLMKEIISYCKTKDKNVGYSMTTNGTLLNDEVNKLIVENKISTIISIDGDKEKNDKNRYHKDGTGSYDQTVKNTKELRKEYGLTSRATLTPGNLDMVNTFNHLNGLGFKNIPMTPANNLTSDAEFVEYINSEIELIEYAKEFIHSNNCSKVRKMTFIYSALLSLHRVYIDNSVVGQG